VSVEEALRRALKEVAELKARIAGEPNGFHNVRIETDFDDIVGRTPALLRLLDQITQVAATNSTVLVTGETGTGRIWRAVHRQVSAAASPW
jgi:transcriptional regulator with GAF, ATPase, and Fis domain